MADRGSRAEALPAWSAPSDLAGRALPVRWPEPVTREWAWGGSTGAGTRVCVVDSGIEPGHPLVGRVDEAVAVVLDPDGEPRVEPDGAGDVAGHGTACGGIVRLIAPGCELHSVRVLGPDMTGGGSALLAGLEWAVAQGFDVVNLSLSTRKRDLTSRLTEIADEAYFRGTVLIASAHNGPVRSYPWRFASVLSVGSHEGPDPLDHRYNPDPPVEFFARGVDVEVPWPGGGSTVVTGNSIATAHLAGLCALILSKHPGLAPFELKSILYLTATNVGAPA